MSDTLENVKLSFILELARTGLNAKGTIFCVGRYLKENRTKIETLLKENPNNIGLVAKKFILQWYENNKENGNKFLQLRSAFEKADCGGKFEEASKSTGFARLANSDGLLEYSQFELDDSNLDDKLITLLEELPALISTEDLLYHFGILCGFSGKMIESIRTDNRSEINEAGRELIQKIITKEKGSLCAKVSILKKAYESADGPREFKLLLEKNGILEADLQEGGTVQAVADVSNSFQGLVVHDQAGAANNDDTIRMLARQIADEGVYDENQALFAAEQLTEPTAARVNDLLSFTFPGQTEPVQSSILTAASQIGLGDSGFKSA